MKPLAGPEGSGKQVKASLLENLLARLEIRACLDQFLHSWFCNAKCGWDLCFGWFDEIFRWDFPTWLQGGEEKRSDSRDPDEWGKSFYEVTLKKPLGLTVNVFHAASKSRNELIHLRTLRHKHLENAHLRSTTSLISSAHFLSHDSSPEENEVHPTFGFHFTPYDIRP
jgi:hypothetical protein